MDPVLAEDLALTALVALLVAVLGILVAGRFAKQTLRLVAVFLASVLALSLLGYLDVDSYPWSNILILVFAVSGGVALGGGLSKRAGLFFATLVAVSVLDVASFLIGPQGSPSQSQPSVPGNLSLYINFVVRLGPNSTFRLGSLDLLLLCSLSGFFLPRPRSLSPATLCLAEAASLLLPFGFLPIHPSGGLPLTPSITLIAAILQALTKITGATTRLAPENHEQRTIRSLAGQLHHGFGPLIMGRGCLVRLCYEPAPRSDICVGYKT